MNGSNWRSRQNKHTSENQVLAQAHRPKSLNSDVTAISRDGSPDTFTELNIYWQPADGRGRYRAELADGTVLCVSRQPFLDSARALIAAGYSRDIVLFGRRKGSANWSLRGRLGDAAKLTVDETKTQLAKWKPFSGSAVASPMRSRGGAATTLAKNLDDPSCSDLEDPAPPDKRRRPRTGNAGALKSSDKAAAAQIYPTRNASASPSTQAGEKTDSGA